MQLVLVLVSTKLLRSELGITKNTIATDDTDEKSKAP